MIKRHALKLLVGLAVVLTLLGGLALGTHASAANGTPVHPHILACDAYPPCY